jgi:hypothetical protein
MTYLGREPSKRRGRFRAGPSVSAEARMDSQDIAPENNDRLGSPDSRSIGEGRGFF